MKNEVAVSAKDFGIEEVQAKEITKGLDQILAERAVLEKQYSEIIELEITKENLPKFKALRLRISKNRTQGVAKWKTTNKAYFLAGGNFVQAIYNKEVAENERMEANLLSNEKHFENLELERLAELQASRALEIGEFVEDADKMDLSGMADDVYEAFLTVKKDKHLAFIEAEKKAEAERVEAQRIEREKIEAQRIENERLKKEAEARQKEQAIKDAKAEAERKELERIQKEKEKKAEAERLAIQAEANKKIEAEKAKREKLEAEIKAKQLKEAEETGKKNAEILKAKKEAEALAKAPIKEQLNIWVNCFELPPITIDNEVSKDIESKFEAFKKWAKGEIEKM